MQELATAHAEAAGNSVHADAPAAFRTKVRMVVSALTANRIMKLVASGKTGIFDFVSMLKRVLDAPSYVYEMQTVSKGVRTL